jgi:hypothetical protein
MDIGIANWLPADFGVTLRILRDSRKSRALIVRRSTQELRS